MPQVTGPRIEAITPPPTLERSIIHQPSPSIRAAQNPATCLGGLDSPATVTPGPVDRELKLEAKQLAVFRVAARQTMGGCATFVGRK